MRFRPRATKTHPLTRDAVSRTSLAGMRPACPGVVGKLSQESRCLSSSHLLPCPSLQSLSIPFENRDILWHRTRHNYSRKSTLRGRSASVPTGNHRIPKPIWFRRSVVMRSNWLSLLLLTLCATAATTLAQKLSLPSTPGIDLQDNPDCALPCLLAGLNQTQCLTTDQTCLCQDEGFLTYVQGCVIMSCPLKYALEYHLEGV
ncbi:hypothetical protein LZ30DRAFT_246016 [Colletotrichum cereale]|nr:hypothetical protein LZ30DRAFT_246016 [Colletotrichum cereale]